MADTQEKRYTNFVNKKPWVDPSFIRVGPPAPLQPGINASALFGLEYTRDKDKSRINQSKANVNKNSNITKSNNTITDDKVPRSTLLNQDLDQNKSANNLSNSKRGSYADIERGVYNLQEKVVAVDRKVDSLDDGYRTVPSRIGEVETNMASNGRQVDELEWRNKVHSAKIHELERELRNVRMENDVIKGRIGGPDGGMPNIPEDTYRSGGLSDRNGYYHPPPQRYHEPDPYQSQGSPRQAPLDEQGRPKRRVYENEQHNIAHRHGGPDGEPYWGFNRYYNPQFVTAYRREHVPYYTRLEEKEQQQQQPGGLYIIRFHDSGIDEVNVSLKEQQTIIKSFNGYVLGLARKQNVIVMQGDSDWRFSRNQTPRPQIPMRYNNVEDAIGLLWFPNREKAFDFFSNSFRNRFKQQGFPTPHGWEGHFIPLNSPTFMGTLDTYLVLELLNIGNHQDRLHNLQQFEAEARQQVLSYLPNSLPFVASVLKGRDAFKPGPMFKDRSKVLISRFNSLSELSDLWTSGTIQRLLQKYKLTVPLNAFAFSLKDWMDY